VEHFHFTKHALEKMFERRISPNQCIEAFRQNVVIEQYPKDTPFPSQLRIGKVSGKVLHVVVSIDGDSVYFITAYEPDPNRWTTDFTKRK
jgi:Domain of unknown function (DUF4258)